MPAPIASALSRMSAAMRTFTATQRIVATIGIALLVAVVVALSMWLSRPTLTPLFSGLSGSDAGAIVEQLRADGITYEVVDGGGTILVPDSVVYEQRMKSAAVGLPTGSTGGYSLLDDLGVTSSEFQQSVTLKRALEGELAATISALDGVLTSSVRLAIPKETIFSSEKADPTASVFVETDQGVELSSSQIEAIVHLTSASIEGMSPTGVAVIDASGRVLSAVGVGPFGSGSQKAADYEQRTQAAVQAMLDHVLGTGSSSVVVAAEMETETAERREERFESAADIPPLNESTTTESYEGNGGSSAGVLGPDNIAVPGGADGEGSYSSESSTRNNAVNKITETRSIPAGAIRSQTVSVAVDETAAANVDIADIRSLVATAAGIDADRGDRVAVEVVPFSTASASEAAEALEASRAAEQAELIGSIVTTAIIAAAIVLPVILAIVLYLRRSRRSAEPVDLGVLATNTQLGIDGISTAAIPFPVTLPLEPATGTEGSATVERMRAEIGALAHRDPQGTAGYLRTLLDERGEE